MRRKEKWERYYPLITAIVFVIIAGFINPDLYILDDIDSILSAVISFASIIIGFLGALIALIFSTENRIMKIVIEEEYYSTRMKKFFLRPIQSGFIWIFLSILFSFRATLHTICSVNRIDADRLILISKLIWLYLFIYFLISSYRVISIILKIVFIRNEKKEIDSEDEIISDEGYEKVKNEKSI